MQFFLQPGQTRAGALSGLLVLLQEIGVGREDEIFEVRVLWNGTEDSNGPGVSRYQNAAPRWTWRITARH